MFVQSIFRHCEIRGTNGDKKKKNDKTAAKPPAKRKWNEIDKVCQSKEKDSAEKIVAGFVWYIQKKKNLLYFASRNKHS